MVINPCDVRGFFLEPEDYTEIVRNFDRPEIFPIAPEQVESITGAAHIPDALRRIKVGKNDPQFREHLRRNAAFNSPFVETLQPPMLETSNHSKCHPLRDRCQAKIIPLVG